MPDKSLILPLVDCRDNAVVGGKAVNLGHLVRAGFPVPDGFVVTTDAFRAAASTPGPMPVAIADAIRSAYAKIGSPIVAVRSSATAEDMADASMAGQYETFLDLQGADAVVDAVKKCWESVDTDRTRSYLKEHNIAMADVAMAVVVQILVPSDVAGVLFTANPRTGARDEMVIEASWGLGESVVSGIVQPDTLTLDRATARVKEATIQTKKIWIEAGSHTECEVPEEKQRQCCLTSQQVIDLWQLGLDVADHYGTAQDLEWGIHGGKTYLLQSRSVTTMADAETSGRLLSAIRQQVQSAIDEQAGPWVLHNISETLPQPTPLTWSIIRRFMSGSGGFGNMYKQVGFEPSEKVGHDGFLDLIGGKVYMDLSRASQMFFEAFPFDYDLDLMRRNPDARQGPPTLPTGGVIAQMAVARKLNRVTKEMTALVADFDQVLHAEIIPEFVAYVNGENERDLTLLSTAEWLDLWQKRERKVLAEFAPKSLLPSLLGAMCLEQLKAFVSEHFWDEDPEELAPLLATGPLPDKTALANQALYEVAQGDQTVDDWLSSYGHRAPEEFDLATPRWREQPKALAAMAARLKDGLAPTSVCQKRVTEAQEKIEALSNTLRASHRREFTELLERTHRYLHYREDGKYYLMLGYEQLRLMMLEAGRRLEIDNDVFLLTEEELHEALQTGLVPLNLLEQRRQERDAEKRLSLPQIITEADLPNLGAPPQLQGLDQLDAFSISAGTCRGPCKIVSTPAEAGDLGKDYILVCPSTDPSWTPLFVNAAGLVLECGGTLSHGAVVAREMGIPAVVVADATALLNENEIVAVDGHNGALLRNLEDDAELPSVEISEEDIRIVAERRPPPVGGLEQRAATLRNVGLLFWGAFLLLTYAVLPAEMLEHRIYALYDALLLPLAASMGKPVVVGLVAVLVGAVCIIAQRLLTDNHRLRIAKKRAAALQREAATLPPESPRAQALLAAAKPVQMRVTMAALVPLAVLLGPMMTSFTWFPTRIDTAARNAKPGSPIIVSALVVPTTDHPVTLTVPDGFRIEDGQATSQTIVNYHAVLERYLAERRSEAPDLRGRHWAEKIAVEKAYTQHLSELETFLAQGNLPLQRVAWTVLPPAKQAGRWHLDLSADEQTLAVPAVLGEGYTPEPKELIDVVGRRGKVKQKFIQVSQADRADAPIQRVEVSYQENLVKGEGTFWEPLDWFESPMDREASSFEMIFAPWLVLYLLVYVPVMFLTKFVLRVP